MEKMKKIINSKYLTYFTIALVALNPLLELDSQIYPFFQKVGIPRLSTIVHFVLIPLLLLWAFLQKEEKKKRTIIVITIYGILLAAYFIVHVLYMNAIWFDLYLPLRFEPSIYQELIYILTLVLPYFLIYEFFLVDLKESVIKKITLFLSASISIPIVLGDIFLFGQSTYFKMTTASIFSWFTPGIYEQFEPRTLASKFFFEEGNTVGILMFMLLPILYYLFTKAISKKEKIEVGILIFIHSVAMLILSTRIATYGVIVMPIAFLGIYLFCCILMKNEKLQISTVLFPLVIAIICYLILPYSPAVMNQLVDNASNEEIIVDKDLLNNAISDFESSNGEYQTRYDPALVYQFQTYALSATEFNAIYPGTAGGANLLGNVPRKYFNEWYPYNHDAVFWVEVILVGTPPEQRVNGRQIQKIFFDYKMAELDGQPKWLGMGYSPFMNGSIVLEQDFVQQLYTLGYVGSILTTLPWILVVGVAAVLIILKWKKLFTLEVLVYAVAICAALGSSYMSGHTLDEFTSSIYMAFVMAILFRRIHTAYKKEQ